MIFLHNVFDLIEIFFGELIAVLEDTLDLVIYGIERIEILFLKMTLLGLICQQRDFICYFLIIFH